MHTPKTKDDLMLEILEITALLEAIDACPQEDADILIPGSPIVRVPYALLLPARAVWAAELTTKHYMYKTLLLNDPD